MSLRVIRTVVVALLVGAAWCSAAQAIEGPFWSEAGGRLATGESAQFKTGLRSTTHAVFSTSGLTLTCGGLDSLRGSQFKGSLGHHPGRLTETLIFIECSVAGNGTGCEVYKESVESKALLGTLVYPTKTPAKSDDIFEYVYPEAGVNSTFMEIKFVGGACVRKSLVVEGSITGEVQNNVGAPIKIGEEPAEAMFGTALFAPAISSSWEELEENVFEEQSSSLKVAGESAELEFDQFFGLAAKTNWGVYT